MSRKKKEVVLEEQTEIVENEKRQKRLISPNAFTAIKLTENQKKLLNVIEENKIIIISGPAGSGKTAIDCYYALEALHKHKFDKIILSKPIEESGEKLGFLPGTIEEKINPFIESFKSNLLTFINKQAYEKLIKDEYIQYRPLAYMRGTTFSNSLMILDEAQNADLRQIILFVTRMGRDSKIIISGDVRQYDIAPQSVGMLYFAEMVKDIEKVAHFEFTEEDIMRDEILKEITKRYEFVKMNNKIPINKK